MSFITVLLPAWHYILVIAAQVKVLIAAVSWIWSSIPPVHKVSIEIIWFIWLNLPTVSPHEKKHASIHGEAQKSWHPEESDSILDGGLKATLIVSG